MKTIKLKEHKYANTRVTINNNGDIELWSYSTLVLNCIKNEDNLYTINCSGLYSNTTRRHISWFMEEYFQTVNYYDIKKAYSDNASILGRLKGGAI